MRETSRNDAAHLRRAFAPHKPEGSPAGDSEAMECGKSPLRCAMDLPLAEVRDEEQPADRRSERSSVGFASEDSNVIIESV